MQAILALEDGRIFRGTRLRRAGRGCGRGRLQYIADRLPGDLHRSLVRGPDRGADQSAHRELWNDAQRCGVRAALHRGAGDARVLRDEFQLAGHRGGRRLPGAQRRSRARRGGHARRGAPSAHAWRDARRHRVGRVRWTRTRWWPRRGRSARWKARTWPAWSPPNPSTSGTQSEPRNQTGDALLPVRRCRNQRRAAACGGVRLRNQAEHPAHVDARGLPRDRGPGHHDRRRDAGAQPRRRLLLQRPGRSRSRWTTPSRRCAS